MQFAMSIKCHSCAYIWNKPRPRVRIYVKTFDRIFHCFDLEMESHIIAFSTIVDACLFICQRVRVCVCICGKHSVIFEITLHRRYHLASIWAQLYVNVHSINVSTTFEFIHQFSFQLYVRIRVEVLECIWNHIVSIWNHIWHAISGNCAKYIQLLGFTLTAIDRAREKKSNSLIKRLCVFVCV